MSATFLPIFLHNGHWLEFYFFIDEFEYMSGTILVAITVHASSGPKTRAWGLHPFPLSVRALPNIGQLMPLRTKPKSAIFEIDHFHQRMQLWNSFEKQKAVLEQ